MLNPDCNKGSRPSPITNEVRYTGVRKRKWGMYVSEIRIPNSRERIWLGSYDTAEQAARAFDAALFCLRGSNAKFNFPADPPMISGGQSLAPVDIQRVAQEYAFAGIIIHLPLTTDTNNGGVGDVCGANAEVMENDWSDLNEWDTYGSPLVGNASDFGYFSDPGQMYLPYANSNEEDESGCVVSPFLWSF